MIGTRAHGRSRVYRYYTCFTRVRYDTGRCHANRLDADAAEHAVITALTTFYRERHDLIADSIAQAQASHAAAKDGHRAELAAAEHQTARTGAAIDRYLTAFENGTLDPEDLAGRLAQLKSPVSTAARPQRRTRRPGRRNTRAGGRHLAGGRRPHRRHRRIRQPLPAQGPDRGPHRPDQDHRARPDSPGLPHTTAASRQTRRRFRLAQQPHTAGPPKMRFV